MVAIDGLPPAAVGELPLELSLLAFDSSASVVERDNVSGFDDRGWGLKGRRYIFRSKILLVRVFVAVYNAVSRESVSLTHTAYF